MQLEDVQDVLPHLLPSGECVARPRGRHRHRARLRARASSTSARSRPGRRPAAGASRRPRSRASSGWCSRIASSCRASTWRGTRRRCSRRRCRAGSGRRSAGQRQDVAAVSHARLRAAHRARRVGVPELARARQASSCSPPRRRPAIRSPRSPRASTTRSAARADDGPTDEEMERAVAQAEAQFMYRLQTVGGFGGKSDQLNAYNVFRGDPGFFAAISRATGTRRRQPSRAAAGASCARSPRRPQRRSPRPARPGAAGSAAGDRVVMTVDRSRLPELGPDPAFRFPRSCATRSPTGWSCGRSSTPACRSSRCSWCAVAWCRPADSRRAGRDHRRHGGRRHGGPVAIDVSDALARIGADYDIDVGADATVFSLVTLTRFADRGATLLADMVTRPALRERISAASVSFVSIA